MKNFRNISLIIFALWSFMFSLNIQSQVNNISQNRTYDADATKNVVFFIGNNECINITIDLNMMSFQDQNGNYYGYDLGDGNSYQPIPDNWDFEITNLPSPGSELSSDGKTFKYCTGSENPNNTFTIRIKVFDKNSGTEISNLGNVNLTLYIRDKFKIGNGIWNACVSRFILSVSETIDGNNQSACSPYTIKVYRLNEKDAGPIYENTQDSNTWNLDLDIGQYQADVTDSCGQVIENYLIDIRDAYTFSVDILFEGFQCFDDNSGRVVVQIKGAQVFQGGDLDGQIKWNLKNANGDIIRSNGTNTGQSNYSSNQGGGPPFDYGVVDLAIEILGLPEGTYTFYFEDANGCTEEKQITIEKSVPITASLLDGAVDQLACHGDTNGKLCFKASGGWTEPWDGNTINTDAWGAPYSFTLLNLTTGQGYSSGSVTNHFDSSGNQDGYQTCFNNLPAGKYRLTVGETVANDPYDSTKTILCERSFQEFEITEPDPITTSQSTIKGITCKGDDDGAINLVVAGGTSPFTYSWTKSGDASYSASTEDLSDLSPGTYNVTISDANDCSISRSFTIEEPDTLEMQASILTEILCHGDDGSIKAEITKQSDGPYVFRISGTDYNNNTITPVGVTLSDVNNLSTTFVVKAGTYTVSVTDANGCQLAEENITLTQPDAPLTIDSSTIQNISCFGADDGSIDITVSGGTVNSGSELGYANFVLNGQGYIYKTNDGGNSWKQTSTSLIANGALTLTTFINENVGYGSVYGAVYKTIDGAKTWNRVDNLAGTPPSNGISEKSFVSEKIGYGLMGNSKIKKTIDGGINWNEVNRPDRISGGTHTISHPHFISENIGYITNECDLYKTIDGSETWTKISSIPGKCFSQKQFLDANNGFASIDEILHKTSDGGSTWTEVGNAPITGFRYFSFVNESVGFAHFDNGAYGTLNKTTDGGLNWFSPTSPAIENIQELTFFSGGLYTFSWTKVGDSSFSATTEDISNLSPGTYIITITDANGCSTSKQYTVTEPQLLVASGTKSSHNGFEITCNGADDGSIDLTVSGGTSPYVYSWTKSGDDSYTSSSEDLSDLSPGTYQVNVTDANGCSLDQTFTISEPDELLITSSVLSAIGCYDGNANIQVDVSQASVGPYVFRLFGNDYNNQPVSLSSSSLVVSDLDAVFNTVKAGVYTIRVSDRNNCFKELPLIITQPDAITIDYQVSDYNGFSVSCVDSSNGSINISLAGGTTNSTDYTFSWSTSDGSGLDLSSLNQNGLTAGTYNLIVSDDNGCSVQQEIVLDEPTEITITENISDYSGYQVSTSGGSDGTIVLNVVGGTNSYTYQWSTNDGSGLAVNQKDQSGLSAGTYTVVVTDSNGCSVTKTYTLEEPTALLISIDNSVVSNIACFEGNTGKIKIDIDQASVGPYTYEIFGTTYTGDPYLNRVDNIDLLTYTFTGLVAGKYQITVTDGNGNSTTTGIKEITQPETPLIVTAVLSSYGNFNVGCQTDNDGSIDITVSGGNVAGNANYTYVWSTSDGSGLIQGEEDQSGLGPGTYTVSVTDENSCTATQSFTLTQAQPLNYVLDRKQDITCFGDDDGVIEISVTDGTGVYTYDWSTTNGSGLVQGQQDQSGLSPGDYKLILSDSCTTLEYNYTIRSAGELGITLDEVQNVLCFGDSTGKISVTVSGGTQPYNYVWVDNFGNTYNRDIGNVFNSGNLSNIPAGTYTLTVTDSNQCSATLPPVEITEPADLLLSFDKTDLSCYNSNDGTITVTASGGVSPYTYTWSDLGNGSSRDNLAAGTYSVIVKDANECEEKVNIVIANAELFDVDPVITQISCFGANDGSIELNFVGGVGNVNVQWNDDSTAGVNRNNLSPGVYSVLITDESSCTIERDFTIIEPQEIEITGIITNAIDCIEPNSGSIDLQVAGGTAPYTFLWSNGFTTEDLANVPANNYLVTVTDSNGCISEKEFEITRQDDLEIILDTELFAICDTRDVFQKSTVSVSGGVAPYTITWSNGVVSGTNGETMDTNLEGSYEVTVTDFLGCSESLIFNVNLPDIGYPEFDYTSFYFTNYGGLSINDPITFTNQSTQEYFSVLWDFGDGNTSTDENPTHTYSVRGWYDVTLTVEFILGCSYSITKTLYIGDDYEMVIPNAFTPNLDNINETFRPVYYGITSIRLTVYDTWGTLIYYEDSTENEMIGWDGTINGKKAENGNFFYQVSATTYTGNLIEKNGSFTLIR